MDLSNIFCSALWAIWLEAIGTILAVLVALFQKEFRDWLNKPKIKIECGTKIPFIQEIEEKSDSSDDNKELIIRIKLLNEGKNNALHTFLIIDNYLSLRNNSSYIKKDINPIQLKGGQMIKNNLVASKIPYYLDLISIHKQDEMTKAHGRGKPKNFYKAFLIGDKESQCLGMGTFILPIKFYCSNSTVQEFYVSIFWDSDDYRTEKDVLSVNILSNKEINNLKID